jgi:hypothetical protein
MILSVSCGARLQVFFHRVEYLDDKADTALDGVEDYKWLTKDELLDSVRAPWRDVLKDMC